MKTLIISAFLLLSGILGFAQSNEYFLSSFRVGTSLTYIPNEYDITEEYELQEYTWNINGSVYLNKRLQTGVQALLIFNHRPQSDWKKYYMYGLFGQFDFFPNQKCRLFLETSINRGDYCHSGSGDPHRVNNLYYWGHGIGGDFPLRGISDRLYLDFAFINYITLNDIEFKYNYTQYIIGIDYIIGKNVKNR